MERWGRTRGGPSPSKFTQGKSWASVDVDAETVVDEVRTIPAAHDVIFVHDIGRVVSGASVAVAGVVTNGQGEIQWADPVADTGCMSMVDWMLLGHMNLDGSMGLGGRCNGAHKKCGADKSEGGEASACRLNIRLSIHRRLPELKSGGSLLPICRKHAEDINYFASMDYGVSLLEECLN